MVVRSVERKGRREGKKLVKANLKKKKKTRIENRGSHLRL